MLVIIRKKLSVPKRALFASGGFSWTAVRVAPQCHHLCHCLCECHRLFHVVLAIMGGWQLNGSSCNQNNQSRSDNPAVSTACYITPFVYSFWKFEGNWYVCGQSNILTIRQSDNQSRSDNPAVSTAWNMTPLVLKFWQFKRNLYVCGQSDNQTIWQSELVR